MAPPTSLVGPPEIHQKLEAQRRSSTRKIQKPTQKPSTSRKPSKPAGPLSNNPFRVLMEEEFNATTIAPPPPLPKPSLIFTENRSPTLAASGNPCLDFFFHVVPDTPAESLTQRLKLAWNHDALTTLKLICNLRGVRGTGKSDKEGYYTASLWLHNHHPKTLATNVDSLAEFGYFKDMPEILYRLLQGADVRKKAKENRPVKTSTSIRALVPRRRLPKAKRRRFGRGPAISQEEKNQKQRKRQSKPAEARVSADLEKGRMEKMKARKNKEEKKIAAAMAAYDRYNRDPNYRFFFDRVSDLFSDCLKSDVDNFNSGHPNKISLAAKWCPSLDSSFDRYTLLCESIARKLFPREGNPEYEAIEDAHYAYRVRDRLRKEVLVPLRKALQLPEVYTGANQWNAIPYNRVASVAMKFYKEKFRKHDKDRFEEYLEKVKEGKAKIAAGALLPHEIIRSLNDGDKGEVAELQWRRMVDDLIQKGKLKNCLAICDVSGSMMGEPMEVSVALGVLVSEISEEPWKGKLITFSANPKLQIVEGDDLRTKTNFVRRMEWGMNTNFQKVFDLILQVAVTGKLTPEQMIKRVLVLSDMEFDQASTNRWETDYMAIQRKFTEKGYGSSVPEIVFWNLRDSKATPVPCNQKGVALVSGFSKNLLTLFLDDCEALDPVSVMNAAISGDEYQKLCVID